MRKILFILCIFSILGSHPALANDLTTGFLDTIPVAEQCHPAGAALAETEGEMETLDLPVAMEANGPICSASKLCPDGVTYLSCEGYSHCFNITYCTINCDGNRLRCPGCIEP